MSSDKTPLEVAVDQAMDAFVYAPIGLVFDGPALFPKLVQKGRNQVQVARMMGEMAVQMGQTELGKRASTTSGPLRDVLAGFGLVDPPSDGSRADAGAEPASATPVATENAAARPKTATAKKSTAKKSTAKKASKTRPRAASRASATATSAAKALGIPDYDSLSASQVVQRLRGLVPEELDAVKTYESANRARKTVLNKIVQLQDLRG